ncbi:transcription factor domain-containing protein [Aspergillus alliaceus]|uniref:transcription factor domain-containing protein n=1 Tax=Petromyces alliaceus TaxID=209559 RepID=UPI0012A4BE51|nr:fungal-specific transcription factor domain-containing protein [Aspergillus alliaceus]KAB8228186.1 fungal-specific transcription factor domain-containing protein [Aspergillus alliaceus]
MSTALAADLASGTVDVLLTEVDNKSKKVEGGDVAVGPFGVLKFNTSTSVKKDHPNVQSERTSPVPAPNEVPYDEVQELDPLLSSATDPFLGADEFLHWADFFGLGFDLIPGISSDGFDHGELTHDLYSSVSRSGLDEISNQRNEQDYIALDRDEVQRGLRTNSYQQPALELVSPTSDILTDAPFLLKHFQDNVVGQMMTLPVGQKSPWRILHIPTAVLILEDLMYLGRHNLNHARLSNFYSLLACSAYQLGVNATIESPQSGEHWKQIAHHSYYTAKDHIQQSLKVEVSGPKKAKYKDQLMAISAMAAFAVNFSGHEKNSRCYMIDAERLMRLRGLPKREISRKARVLHHIYTWIRIVGESTYVLHDYSPSASFIETPNLSFQTREEILEQDNSRRSGLDARLDDFLLLQPRQVDSDLDIDAPKEREVALHDIHLEDSRRWADTLYSEIYGIPETWPSLVSQTTRLANLMDTLVASGGTKKYMNSEAARSAACTHASGIKHNPRNLLLPRIRSVHPSTLQSHVDEVIAALKDFDIALSQHKVPGPGTAWPAFMAGCEAMTPPKRDALL